MQFQVLGPIEVVENGSRLSLGGKLAHKLLATLLIHACRVRTADQLIDDLWADRCPPTARASLHNLISRLRRSIGPGLLANAGGGYVLTPIDDQVDVSRFERLLARSRNERAGVKVRTLETAISLWRGAPFSDVCYEEFAQGEVRRLEELHVWALEELLASKLELGESDAVVPELQRLVGRFPFRERLRMGLMIALHQTGRSVEAMVTYSEWTQILSDSWGIDPGGDIQQLSRDICVRAPSLELTRHR